MLSTELVRWHIFHEVQHAFIHSRQAASTTSYIEWNTLLRWDDLLDLIKSTFFDTIKTRNYWPTIITHVHAERFLERKSSDNSLYLMENVDQRIPTYFQRFFHFFKKLVWSRSLGLAPPFWICHYLPGVLGEFSRQAWQVTSHPKSEHPRADYEYHCRPNHEVLLPINYNSYNFRENNAFFFGERVFENQMSKIRDNIIGGDTV